MQGEEDGWKEEGERGAAHGETGADYANFLFYYCLETAGYVVWCMLDG